MKWSKRIADGGYTACSSRPQQRPQDLRKYVGMFVGIDVRDGNASHLQLTNLGGGFGFNLVCLDAAPDHAQGEAAQTLVKAVSSLPGSERWSMSSAKHRYAVHQHDVATHAEPRRRSCALDCVLNCRSVNHESGGGHDALTMGFHDGAVHTLREPEVIRVDD